MLCRVHVASFLDFTYEVLACTQARYINSGSFPDFTCDMLAPHGYFKNRDVAGTDSNSDCVGPLCEKADPVTKVSPIHPMDPTASLICLLLLAGASS